MRYLLSEEDRIFKHRVESCAFPVAEFDHRAHLRLAYIYLAGNDVEVAAQLMRETLMGLLKHAGIEPAQKYHQTLTTAWILAVQHFMSQTPAAESANDFIDNNSLLLDSKIMLSHYSAEVLFSEQARQSFIEPNLAPIPGHSG